MFHWILIFFCGVVALFFLKTLPSLWWLLIPLVLALGYLAMGKFKTILGHLLIFTLGFSWSLINVHWITSWSLPRESEGKNLLITGYVSSLPKVQSSGTAFEFTTETIERHGVKTKIRLRWYHREAADKIRVGDRWHLTVRLKRPHGNLNPGGFDGEKALLVHRLRATGYVVAAGDNYLMDSSWHRCTISRLRSFWANNGLNLWIACHSI